MADGHGFFLEKTGGYSMRDGDLQEEDVWAAVVKERSEDLMSPEVRRARPKLSGSLPASSWALSAVPPRAIPRGFSAASHDQTKMAQQQSSAPLKIPDWSKIYNGKNSKKLGQSREGPWGTNDNGDGTTYHADGDDEDGDDDDGEMLPPHEYIARRLARSQISSFSMCEGVGRTLKGRDLSKVRNAILTKTGFLE